MRILYRVEDVILIRLGLLILRVSPSVIAIVNDLGILTLLAIEP